MEKTKNKKVEELFKSIQESWDDTHTFFYRIGGDRTNVVPIEIYNNIAIADIKALVDYIAPISYDSGYDMVIEQSLIAKFFLAVLILELLSVFSIIFLGLVVT